MNKKQNLLAIALSASFVLAGANVAEANEQDTNLISLRNDGQGISERLSDINEIGQEVSTENTVSIPKDQS